MREIVTSNIEKAFLHKIVNEGKRLDGRNFDESRKLSLSFGSDWGSCMVSLGETRVLAQVSCEVVQPKQIRPNEGILFINVDIGPMASPQFEPNRQSDLLVYLNRLLEKCYKDSKCVDLESLCIVVEEKVWSLRVDVRVLNHCGNLIECSSIATLAALAHFKRPDVTRNGEQVIIHTIDERDPIPTVLYHYPVCVSYGIFGNNILISDPSLIEENVCLSDDETTTCIIVIAMNQYRELCLLDLMGDALHNSDLVHRATRYASKRCQNIVEIIKQSIVSDDEIRQKRARVNFSSSITTEQKMSLSSRNLSICLSKYKPDCNEVEICEQQIDTMELDDKSSDSDDVEIISKYNVVSTKVNTAKVVIEGEKKTSWVEVSSESEDES